MAKKPYYPAAHEIALQTTLNAVRAAAKSGDVVTIGPARRTLDQNAVTHAWYGEIALFRGDVSTLEVKREMKLRCGLPILMAEDIEFKQRVGRLLKNRGYSYEEKLLLMDWMPVTSLMDKAQLTQYMEAVRDYTETTIGLRLEVKARAA